jgi:hypothetical protein
MTKPFLTNQLDEPLFMPQDLMVGAIAPPSTSIAPWETLPLPDWSALRLHRRSWAEGDALEICLDVAGEPVCRALATRDGQFLFGPTGPSWARDMAREVAQEWRADSCPTTADRPY